MSFLCISICEQFVHFWPTRNICIKKCRNLGIHSNIRVFVPPWFGIFVCRINTKKAIKVVQKCFFLSSCDCLSVITHVLLRRSNVTSQCGGDNDWEYKECSLLQLPKLSTHSRPSKLLQKSESSKVQKCLRRAGSFYSSGFKALLLNPHSLERISICLSSPRDSQLLLSSTFRNILGRAKGNTIRLIL